jgi:hypothetical protein
MEETVECAPMCPDVPGVLQAIIGDIRGDRQIQAAALRVSRV